MINMVVRFRCGCVQVDHSLYPCNKHMNLLLKRDRKELLSRVEQVEFDF